MGKGKGKGKIIGIVALGVFAGCGSSAHGNDDAGAESGGTPGFTTTVPATTVLGQMPQEQFATMCSELNTYRSSLANDATFRPVECKFAGIFAALSTVGPSATDAQVQQACSMAAGNCTSTPPPPFTAACDVKPPAACTATVAQYTACLDDSVAAAEASVDSIPVCDSLTVAGLRASGTMTGSPTPPASCMAFAAACPSATGAGDLVPPMISPATLAPMP